MHQCNLRGIPLLIPHVCVFGAGWVATAVHGQNFGGFSGTVFLGKGDLRCHVSSQRSANILLFPPHKNMGNPKKKLSPPKISLRSFSPPPFFMCGRYAFPFPPLKGEGGRDRISESPPSSRLGCQCYMMSLASGI